MKEKEQLTLKTELAVTNAKLQILELNSSQCGSKLADGMNSYFERNKEMSKLSPNANIFVSEKMDEEDNVFGVPAPVLQPPAVQAKQRPKTQMNEMLSSSDNGC